ncbi:two component transcriptional regulator, LuxR family [Nitrosospira multiformis]|uniref:Two component transcriptional regulator, LuxR family n=1 Tax=Nitrosospira multiformis TaxID=1231 RepID=A0A1H8BL65_9PROT|nr:response regulator transcription factor [Nitrosospira multiformis]SEM82884.1 two component transcriptional regulator, LuxR family [Nitrosospira multiformis]
MNTPRTVKIMLVDDHSLFRDGLRNLLKTDRDFEIVKEASTGSAALQYAKLRDIDVILADIELGTGIDGLELAAELSAVPRKPAMLMISMHTETQYVERAKRAGAQGYISKDEPAERILHAIDEVAAGGSYWPPVKIESIPQTPPTPREMCVLKYIAQDLKTKEIAKKLKLKVRTVEAHRLNIRDKFEVKTPVELYKFAVKCMEFYGVPECVEAEKYDTPLPQV